MVTFVNDGTAAGTPFDPSIPNVARVYDYMLGGKDNFAADRQFAKDLLAAAPDTAWSCRQNRGFLRRAVNYCAEQGIDQFLDIGSGLPTMDNVHEVARRVIPNSAVVYVDNDQVALAHAKALLATSSGVKALLGDLRDPCRILAGAQASGLIDLSRPVAIILAAILHFITDAENPADIVKVLRDAMPSGSYLVISHGTHDVRPDHVARAANVYTRASAPLVTRPHAEIASFFDGLAMAGPGLVFVAQWRPLHPTLDRDLEQAGVYGGVGRKP